MTSYLKKNSSQLLLFVLLFVTAFSPAKAQTVINNLQLEYTKTPIGIDVKTPRFSWQMTAPARERGYLQTAYEVKVKDSKGNVVWDSKKLPAVMLWELFMQVSRSMLQPVITGP